MEKLKEFLSYYKKICFSSITLGWTIVMVSVSQMDGWNFKKVLLVLMFMFILTLVATGQVMMERNMKNKS